jgi:hypothetical protein
LVPEVDDESGSGDLSAECNGVLVPVVPTIDSQLGCVGVSGMNLPDSKAKSGIRVASAVLGKSTGERKPSRHFTKTLHHSEDGDTSDGVTKKDRERTSVGESTGNTEEETSTNGTTKSDELDVSRLETTLDVSILLGCLNVTVQVSSFAEGVALLVDNILDAMVRRFDTANLVLVLLVNGRHREDGVGLTEGCCLEGRGGL